MKLKKPRVSPLVVYQIGSRDATTPGIAWSDELSRTATSTQDVAVFAVVEQQNAVLLALARPWKSLVSTYSGTGSGCDTNPSRVWYEAASESPLESRESVRHFNVSDAVAEIRTALSLQVKELAAVLGVERPTVYAWMRGDAEPQPDNRTRLGQLLKVASWWKTISNQPMGSAIRKELDTNGQSLLDLLQDSQLDRSAIEGRMQQIANNLPRQESKPKSILQMAKQRGIDVSRVQENQDVVDLLTGKRTHED